MQKISASTIIAGLVAMLLLAGNLLLNLVSTEIEPELRKALGDNYRTVLFLGFGAFVVLTVLLAMRDTRKANKASVIAGGSIVNAKVEASAEEGDAEIRAGKDIQGGEITSHSRTRK